MANLRDVRREAVFAAEMLLAELDIDPSGRVKIFDVIEDDGVWLKFLPLAGLYGWYERVEDVAGVAINVAHPVGLQRFTAAHELGHHRLGHTSSLDTERTIIDGGRSDDPKEVAADTFAANLLMPLAAVEFHLDRLGFNRRRPRITPVGAYQLSVELGTSYAATVVQLASMHKISWQEATSLRRARPLALKEQLVGRVPDYARAAVWSLTSADDGRHLIVDTGDELHVRLEELRSAGYRWIPTQATLQGFSVVGDRLERLDETEHRRYGATQVRHFVLKAINPGHHAVVVDLRRRWEADEEHVRRRFGVAVDIEASRISEVGRGMSVYQQPQLVAA